MVIYAYFSKITVKSFSLITPQIKDLMRNRDYHKKLAVKYSSQSHWELLKFSMRIPSKALHGNGSYPNV